MDIQTFQEKLNEIRQVAAGNGNVLSAVQVKAFFEGLKPDKEQLIQILKYLKIQGIAIEGLELSAQSQESEEQTARWQAEEVSEAEELFAALKRGEAFARERLAELYVPVAKRLAAFVCEEEEMLQDLEQEAQIYLLMALDQKNVSEKNNRWLQEQIYSGLRLALEEQRQQKFEDDCLVERVEKLDRAVRELSDDEDGQESKFSVEDLAIILDMNMEEIQDVLRLTGDL